MFFYHILSLSNREMENLIFPKKCLLMQVRSRKDRRENYNLLLQITITYNISIYYLNLGPEYIYLLHIWHKFTGSYYILNKINTYYTNLPS